VHDERIAGVQRLDCGFETLARVKVDLRGMRGSGAEQPERRERATE